MKFFTCNSPKPANLFFIVVLHLFMTCGYTTSVKAQITIATPYPVAAQQLTRGLDTSLLTVDLNFLSMCSTAVATVTLPPGVTYIAESVTKTAGTTGYSIVDLGGTANAPVFAIDGVTGPGNIRFTIKRTASCGTAASGKDIITVTSSCGIATENDITINSYNLLSPALALTSPVAINNAVLGQTATRNITVTNGGNGCMDTLNFYIVYAAGGIVSTNSNNFITANGVNFDSYNSNGDTLFYKIFGTGAFGADGLLCNGENVSITENIRIVKCNANTAYGAFWGNTINQRCQTATGSSSITMANGVPALTTTFVSNTPAAPCVNGHKVWQITNSGTGGNAGAMYNVFMRINPHLAGQSPLILSNATVGGTAAILNSGATSDSLITSQFTTDPDGPGGLEDLDGDGQFDDLAPGNSIIVGFDETWICSNACPVLYHTAEYVIVYYNTMCSTSLFTREGTVLSYRILRDVVASPFIPSFVINNEAFPIRLCGSLQTQAPSGLVYPTDSLYAKITLPAGVTYVAGTGKINGVVTGVDVFQIGNELFLRRKGGIPNTGVANFCIEAELIYTCGSSMPVQLPYEVYIVRNNSCNCAEKLMCGILSAQPICPGGPCPDGIGNFQAKAERQSLGWTNSALTTKVTKSSLSALSLKTALPYDTVRISQSGIGGLITYNNLYYTYQLDKAAGEHALIPVGGTLFFKRGATEFTCALPAFDESNSTATTSVFTWNLTALLGTCISGVTDIQTGDSITVTINYLVTAANNGQLFGTIQKQAPNATGRFFHLNITNDEIYCGDWPSEIYLVGVGLESVGGQTGNNRGCITANSMTVKLQHHYTDGIDLFPNEFRPQLQIDSIVVTWPAQYYTLDPTITSPYFQSTYWSSSTVQQLNPNQNILPTTNIPGKIVFTNPGNWQYSDMGNSKTEVNRLVIPSWLATCETPAIVAFNVTHYYKKYYYQPGAAIPPSVLSGTMHKGYVAETKPVLTVLNNTGIVQGVLPQHYWDVQLNNSSTHLAPYVWISLEKQAGSGIVIDSVVLKPSNIVLAATNYATGKDWYQASAAGIAGGGNQQARVYFRYTSCNTDSIRLNAGWNCTAYPTTPTNAQCGAASGTFLKVIPYNSQIQIAMDRQPGNGGTVDMCTEDHVTLIANSAQAANLIDPNVVVYPPSGITLASPIEVEYPLGSNNWQTITPENISGSGYRLNLKDHTGIGTNGLPGTVINPGASGRQVKIRIPFSAGCNFVSGSQLTFNVYGNKPCGSIADGDGLNVKSDPVSITGAISSGNAAMSLNISGTGPLACNNVRTLNLSVTVVGSTTMNGDTAVYNIPAGLAYAGNFTGCALCAIVTEPGISGSTLVKVAMPEGLTSGTAINFSFDVMADGNGCGLVQLEGHAERNIAGLSCGAGTCASSKIIMGTATPAQVSLIKPVIEITNMQRISGSLYIGSSATIAVTYQNNGTATATANKYIVEFYCGNSASPFQIDTLNQEIAAGTSVTENVSLYFPFTCPGNSYIAAKVNLITDNGVQQCLCGSSSYSMLSSPPLPIKFKDITATVNSCNVNLQWQYEITNNTLNHFEIQRSIDGTIYSHVANTISNSFLDVTPAGGNWHYRIKYTGNNNDITYSNVVIAKTTCTAAHGTLNISPNPVVTNSVLLINYVAPKANNNAFIKCMDASGRTVLTKKLTLKQGQNNIKQQLPAIAEGIYTLQLFNGTNNSTVIKFIVKDKL